MGYTPSLVVLTFLATDRRNTFPYEYLFQKMLSLWLMCINAYLIIPVFILPLLLCIYTYMCTDIRIFPIFILPIIFIEDMISASSHSRDTPNREPLTHRTYTRVGRCLILWLLQVMVVTVSCGIREALVVSIVLTHSQVLFCYNLQFDAVGCNYLQN